MYEFVEINKKKSKVLLVSNIARMYGIVLRRLVIGLFGFFVFQLASIVDAQVGTIASPNQSLASMPAMHFSPSVYRVSIFSSSQSTSFSANKPAEPTKQWVGCGSVMFYLQRKLSIPANDYLSNHTYRLHNCSDGYLAFVLDQQSKTTEIGSNKNRFIQYVDLNSNINVAQNKDVSGGFIDT